MFNEEKLKEEREVKWKKIVEKGRKMQQILASLNPCKMVRLGKVCK